MELSFYGSLFEPDPRYFSETYLQTLWRRDLWKQFFRACGGEEIQILDPGDHNPVHGPDFRNARLYIDGVFQTGDIELHFDNQDWYQHGHQNNPDYNTVILHVVFRNRDASTFVRNERRQKIPVIRIPEEQITVENSRSSCEPADISADTGLSILQEMGRKRLLEKAAFFYEKRQRFSFNTLLFWGMFRVCGYRYNADNFNRLFLSFPWERYLREDLDAECIEAVLFHLSGIRPKTSDTYSRELLKMGASCTGDIELPDIRWSYSRSRPPNFPDRRIAWLSLFLKNMLGKDIQAELFHCIQIDRDPLKAANCFFSKESEHPYWQQHFRLGGAAGRKAQKLKPGSTLRREYFLNIVLPLLKAEQMLPSGDPRAEEQLRKIEQALPHIQMDGLYLNTERFLRHHGLEKAPGSRSWLTSQGILYCREHYCALSMSRLCPLCRNS